jgi:hypothetical protein
VPGNDGEQNLRNSRVCCEVCTSTQDAWYSYVSRDRSPVKKPGRNALRPVNTGKQLQERILPVYNKLVLDLQEITFAGVLLKNAKHSTQNPQTDGLTNKDWFVSPVVSEKKKRNQLLCLSAHYSHELRPLGKSFLPFKCHGVKLWGEWKTCLQNYQPKLG